MMASNLKSYVEAIETMLGRWERKNRAVPLSKGYCSRSVYLDTFIERAFTDQGFNVIRIYPVYIRYNTQDEVEHVMKQWFEQAIEKAKTVANPLIVLERVDTLYRAHHKFFTHYLQEGIQIRHEATADKAAYTQFVPFMLCSSDDFDDDMQNHFSEGYAQFIKYSKLDSCSSLVDPYNTKNDVNKTTMLEETSTMLLNYYAARTAQEKQTTIEEGSMVQDPNTGDMVKIKNKSYRV
jgi:hypothetical protein